MALQQLRGVAILLVLWTHLSLSAQLLRDSGIGLTDPGYAGVDLFFVISGYVVVRSLRAHGWSLAYFGSRRALRLYPPLLGFFALSLPAVLLANAYPEGHFVRALFGAPPEVFGRQALGILTGTFQFLLPAIYVNSAMWSLSIEFEFYAALALLIALCGRGRIGAILPGVAAAALAMALLIRLSLLFGADLPPAVFMMLYWKFDFLLPGVLLAMLPPAALSPLGARWGWLAGGCIGAGLLVLACSQSRLIDPVTPNLRDGLATPLALLLFSIAIGVAARLPAGFAAGWPRLRRALILLGDRSYTIYLLHFPCLALLWLALFAWAPVAVFEPWPYAIAQAVLGLALTLLATEILFRLVERPAIALGARLARQHGPARTA